jgi:hypothetical protein
MLDLRHLATLGASTTRNKDIFTFAKGEIEMFEYQRVTQGTSKFTAILAAILTLPS